VQPPVDSSQTDCTHCRKSRVRRRHTMGVPVQIPAWHLQQQQQQQQ
jgi:hypothetical protein